MDSEEEGVVDSSLRNNPRTSSNDVPVRGAADYGTVGERNASEFVGKQAPDPESPNFRSVVLKPQCPERVVTTTKTTMPVVLRMPNTAFGVAMGLAGNSIMWKMAGSALFLSDRIHTELPNQVLWFAAIIVAILIFLTYVYKAIFKFEMVVAEYKDPIRVHFMNTPHLTLLMVALGTPRSVEASEASLQVIFAIGLLLQTCITQFIYEKWMFSIDSNISCAKPQFLLSTVGWFLLTVLGQHANVEEDWGIALPSMCFGAGSFFYVMVTISIFNGLHKNKKQKGSPGLTLLIAPPSVAIVAADNFSGNDALGEFNAMSEMLLGWCFILLLLICKMGPKIAEHPPSFGAYWAYVFPLSALATATIRYAVVVGSGTSEVVAVIVMVLSCVALLVVFVRTFFHSLLCFQGKAKWGDPLLGIHSKYKEGTVTQLSTEENIIDSRVPRLFDDESPSKYRRVDMAGHVSSAQISLDSTK